jgi:uncharacterized alkaline shock family protein YloU
MAVQGTTTISNDVLMKIAVQAAKNVDGVAQIGASSAARSIAKMFGRGETSNAGIDVSPGESGTGQTSFNFTVSTEYGYSIPSVVQNLRDAISSNVRQMTGLTVSNIDVYIEDIIDKSQINKDAIPLEDRSQSRNKIGEEEKITASRSMRQNREL